MSQTNDDIVPGFEDWANHVGLATKKDLANVIGGSAGDNVSGSVDLSDYVTKAELGSLATKTELSELTAKLDTLTTRVTSLENA